MSNVKKMNKVFNGAMSFNQPLDDWNMEKVEEMDGFVDFFSPNDKIVIPRSQVALTTVRTVQKLKL